MKRVLQVISSLEQGGMEAVVLNYFNNMDEEKIIYDFLVIWGSKEGFHEAALLQKGCRIFHMQHPPREFFAHDKELKEFFNRERYDIVHIHSMTSLRYKIAKAAKKSGVNTVIYHSHTSLSSMHKILHNWAKGQLNKWCDYKFACSNSAGAYMYKGDFRIINNAIDTARFNYNENLRHELRQKYNLEDKFIIGNVGRLASVKNHRYLLNTLPYILQTDKDAVIFCIGEGVEMEALQKYAEEKGVQNNFILAGTVGAEVYKYYSMFDVLAFPSKYEGLSVALMEAQANGLPIVASENITQENKVTENFEFLPIGESEENYMAWANTIIKLKNARQDNAAKVTSAGFDIKIEAKKLQEFYLNCK